MFDQDEFYHILLSERGVLLGFIHSLVHDTHLAEDIFQTVLVTAINGAARSRTRPTFRDGFARRPGLKP